MANEHGVVLSSLQIGTLTLEMNKRKQKLQSCNEELNSGLGRLRGYWRDEMFFRYEVIIKDIMKKNTVAIDELERMIKYLTMFYQKLREADKAGQGI